MSSSERTESELSSVVNQLRVTLGKMEVVLSSISESIVWTTEEGLIEWCNAPFDRLLMQNHISLLGRPLYSVMPLQQSGLEIGESSYPVRLARTSGRGKDVYQFLQGGETRHLEIAWSETILGHGEKTIVLTIRDITEAKKVHDALEQEIRYLQLYESVSAAANEAHDNDHVLHYCIKRICEDMHWPVGHAYVVKLEDQKPRLEPSRLWFIHDPVRFESFRLITEETVLEPGEGLPGIVYETNSPKWITNIAAEKYFPRLVAGRVTGLSSAFAFPVSIRGEVVAVLEFFSCDVLEPNKRLLQVMSYIGEALARAFEIRQSKEILTYRALHDSLTGLPNRVLFVNTVNQAILRRQRHPEYNFAVLFFDLDRFKVVNDSLGHQYGDMLLIEVAKRLLNSIRAGDMVARLGGDEFTVFIDDVPIDDYVSCHEISNRIQLELQQPFEIDGHQVCTMVSIGVALAQSGYTNPDEILRDADIAMYKAKAGGGARTETFDSEMYGNAVSRLQLESDLRQALKRDELLLHYQPICSLSTGEIHGFEALIRWNHPERGMIYPLEFIPIAEETGLIVSIGQWVISEACRWLVDLEQKLPEPTLLTVSVNVSGQQFAAPGMVEHLQMVLLETGLNPRKLNLEITESVMMERIENIRELLAQLQKIKINLHVDDFGTGYSSLSYLSQLPIDTLKIDRSFAIGMESSEENVEIIRCVLALAHTLNMDVITEGVETSQAAQKLLSLGCERVQGYYYYRPQSGKSMQEIMTGKGKPVNGEIEAPGEGQGE